MAKKSNSLYKLAFAILGIATKANDIENILNGDADKVVKKHLRKNFHKRVNKVASKATKYIK